MVQFGATKKAKLMAEKIETRVRATGKRMDKERQREREGERKEYLARDLLSKGLT